jgi:sec-independent protein translocase protein TatB
MFDIGFLELLICGIIALLVLGPERLPTAARAAGRWVGGARRMVSQFTSELDRQLKADELREELRKAGDIGLDDVQKTVRGALDEAKKYEYMTLPGNETQKPRPASATRRVSGQPKASEAQDQAAASDSPQTPDSSSAGNEEPKSKTPQSPPDNRS